MSETHEKSGMNASSEHDDRTDLRRRAEEQLKGTFPEKSESLDPEAAATLLHELQVHQIELELQNEELRRAQQEMEQTRLRLSHLYQNAPVGYVVLDRSGLVVQANSTFSRMLGVEVNAGKPFADFIAPEDQSVFRARFKSFFRNPANKFIELKLARSDGSGFDAHLEAQPNFSFDADDRRQAEFDELLVTVIDISEKKAVQRAFVESEERVQMVLRGADLGSWDWQVKTGKVVFNERWAAMLGYSLEEITGNVNSWKNLIHPDDIETVYRVLEENLRGETPVYESEHRLRTKSGGWIWVLDRGQVTERDEDGEAVRMSGTHLDITERKQAEKNTAIITSVQEKLLHAVTPGEACKVTAETVQEVIEHGVVVASLFDESVNAAQICAYAGLDVEVSEVNAVLGMDPTKEIHSMDDMTEEEIEIFYSGRLRKLPGGIRALLTRKVSHQAAKAAEKLLRVQQVAVIGFVYGGQQQGGISILAQEDILHRAAVIEEIIHLASITIHRMKADAAKLETERKFRQLFDGSRDGYVMVDLSRKIIDCNSSYCDMLGYSLEELQAMNSFDDVTPAKWHSWEYEEIWEHRLLQKGYSGIYEKEYIRKDGSVFPVELHAYAVYDNNGELSYIWGMVRDIAERKEAERAIAEERERLMVTLASIGDGVITTDTEGKVVLINRIGEELTGWGQEEAAGRPLEEVFSIINEFTRKPCANPVQKVLSTGEIIKLGNHTMLISRDGIERVIADSGAPIKDAQGNIFGVVLVFRDDTEMQRLSEHMQRTDKLDALGVLAGGIAHDFNNLLGGIFGYIDIAREYSADNHTVHDYLDRAMSSFNRAKDLTQQLLTFSKGGAPMRQSGDIAATIKANTAFVLSGSAVRCAYDIPDSLWHCNYDENQIGQVLDNLIINAQQAMPMGGTITVTARNVTLEDQQIGNLPAGRYVRISITDEGVGIPANIIKRIFDPFFTTKHQGSGLGLATCYSILQKHDGHIAAASQDGGGSVFTMHLPAVHSKKTDKQQDGSREYRGSGTILIMDDEEFIRKIAGTILRRTGFEIIEAADGLEAIEKCRSISDDDPEVLRAAILDLTVPGGMGGKETVVTLREEFPALPVLASSGYSDDPVMSRPEEFGFTASIRKPYGRRDLLDTVFDVLDES